MATEYFIGIDGGGSKTRIACYQEDGSTVGEALTGGTYYRQDGVGSVIGVLKEGIARACPGIELSKACACFGMPGYGENKAEDDKAIKRIIEALAPTPVCFVNDVAAGWAGALALNSGVNIVAGTGSIAFGRDPSGKTARCGGWSEYFSDEGSGYWLGKKALSLFAKQCDCRAERGPLYDVMRRHLALNDDYELVGIIENGYAASREKTASLQRVLLEAALEGDTAAIEAYSEAARELALIVCGTAKQLDFAGRIRVSYTGGLFNLKELILEAMGREIRNRIDAELCTPLLSPCEGAAMLAAEAFAPQTLSTLRQNLLISRGTAPA